MAVNAESTDGVRAPRVLIGFAESLAAIETAWTLLDGGCEVHAFTRSGRRPALAHSGQVSVHEVPSPQVDAELCVAAVAALAIGLGVDCVLPLDDDAVWICDRAGEDPVFPVVAGPTGPAAALALDKAQQVAMARRAGLAVPPTIVVAPGRDADLSVVPAGSGHRRVAKPALAVALADGVLGRGRATVSAQEVDLRTALRGTNREMLVQPWLDGVGEGLFGFATEKGLAAWSGHRRIRMMNPAGSGSSACRSIDPDPSLIPAATRFLTEAGWRGLFMLEFLRDDDGVAWFMELNGRPWGSMTLARHRGLVYPQWAVQSVLSDDFEVPEVRPADHVVARHLGREALHLVFVGRAFLRDPRPTPGRLGLFSTARRVLVWRRGDRLYNYRRGEHRVFLADVRQTIADKWHEVRTGS